MKSHPRVRGPYPARLASLVFGLFLFGLGIVLILESRLGLSPCDVLSQGVSRQTPLSFGMANVAVGLAVLVAGWRLGGRIGFGTVANAVLIGVFIDGLSAIDAVARLSHDGLAVRIPLLLAGIALVGLGSAFYIGADLGAGPRDTLMIVGSRRSGVRIGAVRAVLELGALAAGIALGGTYGAGTVLFALGIGPTVEASFWLLALTPLAVASPEPVPVVIAE